MEHGTLLLSLACLGGLVVLRAFWLFARWFYATFLRRINLSPYMCARGPSGCWAVVTGATDGIGLAFAQRLRVLGFDVLLVGRSAEKLTAVAAGLADGPGAVDTVVSEASDVNSVRAVVSALAGRHVAVLVNNVGVGQGGRRVLQDLQPDAIAHAIAVNCAYPVLLQRALMPALTEACPSTQHRRLVINVSSIGGLLANPLSAVYGATKAFNRSFSLSTATEAAHLGIDVVCVSPGYVASAMTGMRPGLVCCSAAECADAALRRVPDADVVPHWKHAAMLGALGTLHMPLSPAAVFRVMSYFRSATERLRSHRD